MHGRSLPAGALSFTIELNALDDLNADGLETKTSEVLLRELWRTVDDAAAREAHALRSGELYVSDKLRHGAQKSRFSARM
jgi:hypothetical protein